MQSFEDALNEHYDCANRDLKGKLDKLLVAVPEKYNCYVEFFKNRKEGDPTAACRLIDVPRFNGAYVVYGLEYDLGVPQCVRMNASYNFAPKRRYELDDCEMQVNVFIGKPGFGYSTNAKAAQEQYDTYMRNLRQELDRRLDDAIRKFNCISRRGSYCF